MKIHRINKPSQQVVYNDGQHQRKLVTLVYEQDMVQIERALAALEDLQIAYESGEDYELPAATLIEVYKKVKVSLT
jgi:thiamine monophosphate kinase